MMQQPTPAPARAQTAPQAQPTVHAHKGRMAAMALLIFGLALALSCVLFVPMLVSGTEPASSRVNRALSLSQPQIVEGASYATLEEAAIALGFTPKAPAALPEGYVCRAIRVLEGGVLEIVYQKDYAAVAFRTALGNDDLSYDQTEYPASFIEEVDGVARSYAGPGEAELKYAVWAANGHSFALVAETPVEADVLRAFAEGVA